MSLRDSFAVDIQTGWDYADVRPIDPYQAAADMVLTSPEMLTIKAALRATYYHIDTLPNEAVARRVAVEDMKRAGLTPVVREWVLS